MAVVVIILVSVVGYKVWNKKEDEVQFTGNSYIEYVDNQNFMGSMSNIQLAPNGVYYYADNMIFFYDNNAKLAVPLCNRNNCEHYGDENCNAYFNNAMPEIYYSNDKLYLVAKNSTSSNTYYLYEISPDGSERKKGAELFTAEGEYGVTYSMIVHRGYACYTLDAVSPEVETVSLYRVKLGSSQSPTEISKMEGYKSYYDHLKADGDKLYYIKDYKESEASSTTSRKLYVYDLISKEETCIKEDDTISMFIDGEKIYCTDNESLYLYDKQNKTSEKLYEFPESYYQAYMNFDGTNFYLDNYFYCIFKKKRDFSERSILVVNTLGELVDSIALNTEEELLFGDSKTMYIQDVKDREYTKLRSLDKAQLGAEQKTWETLIDIKVEQD